MKLILPVLAFLSLAGIARVDTVKLVTGNDYAPFTGEDLPEGGLITALVK